MTLVITLGDTMLTGYPFVCAAMLLGAVPDVAGEATTYSYDLLGRLIDAVYPGTINSGFSEACSHDAAENRSKITVTGSSFSTSIRVIVVALGGLFIIPIGSES